MIWFSQIPVIRSLEGNFSVLCMHAIEIIKAHPKLVIWRIILAPHFIYISSMTLKSKTHNTNAPLLEFSRLKGLLPNNVSVQFDHQQFLGNLTDNKQFSNTKSPIQKHIPEPGRQLPHQIKHSPVLSFILTLAH